MSLTTDTLIYKSTQSVLHILETFVFAILAMIAELRCVKRVLGPLKILIRSYWLPSDLKMFADAQSRRLLNMDLQKMPQLSCSIDSELHNPRNTFLYHTFDGHSHVNWNIILSQLTHKLTTDETLVLYIPPDISPATPRTINQAQTPEFG